MDECIVAARFIIFVVLLGAAIHCGYGLRENPSRPPITILVVGQTGASTTNVAQVFFTNLGHRHYNCAVTTEVFGNGVWREAPAQFSEAGFALPPGSHGPFWVPIRQDGQAWRVKLVASRALGKMETDVDWLFRCLKLEYPFGKSFQVTGPEMVNQPAEATRNQVSRKFPGRVDPTS